MRAAALLAATLCASAPATAQERLLFVRERDAAATAPTGAVIPAAAPERDEAEAAAADALDALAQARAGFLASNFREAVTALRAAEQRTAPVLVRDRRDLVVRLALWAGACALLGGERAEAAGAMQRALALEPGAELPGEFPPEVQSFFAEVARMHRSTPMATLALRTEPPGARVEVDGRAVGRTPIALALPRGPHHLRVERVGYRALRELVEPGREGEAPLRYALVRATPAQLRAQAADPAGLPEAPDLDTLAAMARAFGLDRALFAGRDGARLEWPAPRPPPRGGTSPWWWVLGGAGGAAVVASIVVTVLVLTGDDAPPGPRLNLVLGF